MNARRRIADLLLLRATEGLSPAQQRGLERLLARTPGVDRDFYEHAAAIVCLAACAPRDAMPRSLRDAVAADAASIVGGKRP